MHFSFLYSAKAVFSLHIIISTATTFVHMQKYIIGLYILHCRYETSTPKVCLHFVLQGLQKWVFSDSLLDSKGCREKVESEGLHEAHWWERGSKVGEKVKETDRKSLGHGWMRLVEMAAWAEKPWNLKQQPESFSLHWAEEGLVASMVFGWRYFTCLIISLLILQTLLFQ